MVLRWGDGAGGDEWQEGGVGGAEVLIVLRCWWC